MSLRSILMTYKINAFLKKYQKKKSFDENASEFYSLPVDSSLNLVDSYYFTGHSKDGQSVIVRLGERSSGNNEVWFAYRDALDNDYICAHQILENQSLIEKTCLQAGKKWKIQYSGGVIPGNKTPVNIWKSLKGTRIIPTVFEGEFTAINDIYEYSKHSEPLTIAKALSLQEWNKNDFESFLNGLPIIYEQAGKIQGVFNFGGKKTEIDMLALRRRTSGVRDLSKIKRQLAFNILTENSQAISLHFIDSLAGNFQVGFITSNEGNVSLDSVNIDELPIDIIPNNFKFLAQFKNGKKLVIKCEKETEFEFSYDDDNYKIIESVTRFDINGTKARGIIRLGYNISLNR
ncbi:MAG TPA: hypothetical protein VIL23_01790 [Clostridia bacterium]